MMKLLILLISICFTSAIAQNSGWEVIYKGSQYYNFYDCFFINADTGFVVGEPSVVLKTTDGGKSWNIYETSQDSDLLSVFFVDNKGWVCGRSPLIGFLLTTTNYGETWNEHYNFFGYTLNDIFFLNADFGFIVQSYGQFLKTTDGGLNWVSGNIELGRNLRDVCFVSDSTGWVGGAYRLFKTTDQGQSWINTMDDNVRRVYFINEMKGWIITSGPIFGAYIFSTIDGGGTWNLQLSTVEGRNVNRIDFINEFQGWAVGDYGLIWHTTNGGDNWIRQDSVTDSRLYALSFPNENIGYAAGDNGTILKTTTGGLTGIVKDNNIKLDYNLCQNYPNPFNPSTKIKFTIPSVGAYRNTPVQLKVYDVLGNEIATLVNEELPAGEYEVEFNPASGILYPASGIYFYQLRVGNPSASSGQGFIETKKMILMK